MNHKTTVRILDHRTPEEREREFLPGMSKPWLLPLYDALSRFSGVRSLHDRTAALAGIAPDESVLDVGCGTANLSLAVLRAQPAARVTGLDPDAAALRIAARKAGRRRVALTLVQGFADRLPTADGSVDHIVSSLALHHVPDEGRISFGREAFRALRPGGKVTIADFGGPHGAADGAGGGEGGGHSGGRAGGRTQHHGHGDGFRIRGKAGLAANPHIAQGFAGGLLSLLTDAGFTDVREVARVEHRFGPITFVQATRT
jgi:SAM-dependent methyltransferase